MIRPEVQTKGEREQDSRCKVTNVTMRAVGANPTSQLQDRVVWSNSLAVLADANHGSQRSWVQIPLLQLGLNRSDVRCRTNLTN